MEADKESVFTIQTHYDWPNPDAKQLVTFLQFVFLPSFNKNLDFEGSIEIMNSTTLKKKYKFESFDKWATALENGISYTSGRFTNLETYHNIDIIVNFIDYRLSFWATISEDEYVIMEEIIRSLEKHLQLINNDTQKGISFIEYNYFIPKPIEPKEFLNSFSLVVSQFNLQKINGEIKFASPSGSGLRYSNYKSWSYAVEIEWSGITQIYFHVENRPNNLRLQWNYTTDNLNIRVEASSVQEANSILAGLEKKLNITPVNQGGTSRLTLEGGERIYFAKNNVDKDWFRKAIHIIMKYFRPDFYCELRLRISSNSQQVFVWQNISEWQENVLNKWTEMLEASSYLSGPSLTLNFRYDHRRERVILEVKARSKETAEQTFDNISQDLELQQIASDIYAHPQSSGYFAISSWHNKDFADSLESIVKQFIKSKYFVQEATIIETAQQEGESIHNFKENYGNFLVRLKSDKPYDEVHFKVQGPRGAALGIHVREKRKRLEIKSSLNTNEFINLVQIFKDNLGLKKIAETREAAQSQKTSLKDSIWVIICLPIFLSLLTNALLTEQIKNAPYSKNTLEIIAPLDNQAKPVTIPSKTVHFIWVRIYERWLDKDIFYNNTADIKIVNDAGKIMAEKKTAKPNISFVLPPGSYQAVITIEEYGLKEAVSFEIPIEAR
ncbi:hypothetical protein QNI19_38625 [Cytophagaceae bacterium DM2B3-1]|uniref:Uncharacterized protein n=1 Tax=Xanthocytophaga flava TaxID=3048013 RepID=A0ABT7D161_9BACT|nr:hypothetical protein [Xanthocytophaga flavus]MDJ1498907.1 hypothetical protein [Xanthocytophaga flavus]